MAWTNGRIAFSPINEIRTAIRELSVRAELAHKEGRHDDAAEIERRIDGYREELGHRP